MFLYSQPQDLRVISSRTLAAHILTSSAVKSLAGWSHKTYTHPHKSFSLSLNYSEYTVQFKSQVPGSVWEQ